MRISLAQFKSMQRFVWGAGDSHAMAEAYEGAAKDLVGRLAIQPDERVIDIATGTGNAALAAARAGARAVIGLDITPELFDIGQARADEEHLAVEWREGDAEALPYPDGSFDVATSTFGIMFAPRHRHAARELVRVLRPGGRFGLASWVPNGIIAAMYEVFDSYLPPLPSFAGHPRAWGDRACVEALFADLGVALQFDVGVVPWVFASAEDAMVWMEEVAGPVIAAKATLEATGDWAEARARVVEHFSRLDRPDIGGCWIRPEYLVVLGHRTR